MPLRQRPHERLSTLPISNECEPVELEWDRLPRVTNGRVWRKAGEDSGGDRGKIVPRGMSWKSPDECTIYPHNAVIMPIYSLRFGSVQT